MTEKEQESFPPLSVCIYVKESLRYECIIL